MATCAVISNLLISSLTARNADRTFAFVIRAISSSIIFEAGAGKGVTYYNIRPDIASVPFVISIMVSVKRVLHHTL